MQRGYDEANTLLLPPRAAGERLPSELVDAYEGERRLVFGVFCIIDTLCYRAAAAGGGGGRGRTSRVGERGL